MCGGSLRVRDTVERFVKISSSEQYGITIRRLACNMCGKLHRELPDFLLPHKHYPAECIEAEIDRNQQLKGIREDVICAYPELSTCSRWRREFVCKAHHQRYENLLLERRKTGIGWLADCIRIIVNAGPAFCTEVAFSNDAAFIMIKEPIVSTSSEHHCAYEEEREGGGKNMKRTESSIIQWLLLEIRRVHFQDSVAYMATTLGVPEKVLQSAFNNAGGQRIVDVFEETMRYCISNRLGLDAILMRFPGVQGKD